MTIRDKITVKRYCEQHSQMLAMLDNIREFIESMPAPDEDGNIHGVDYGYAGDVGRIHAALKEANDVAYEMGE